MATGKTDGPLLSRFEEDYQAGISKRCHLYVGISDNLLHLTIFDPILGKIQGIEEFDIAGSTAADHVADRIRIALNSSQAGEEFDAVLVSYNCPHCTLVPDAVFESDRCRDYLALNYRQEFSGICMSEKIGQSGIHIVYHYPSEIATIFQQLFHSVTLSHAGSSVIDAALREYKAERNPVLLVHPSAESMSITLVENGELKLFNYFEYRSPEDLVYYILFVVEQLKLRPTEVMVILAGQIQLHDESYNLLKSYVHSLTFYDTWHKEEVPSFFNQLEKHRYFWPINHIRCAS